MTGIYPCIKPSWDHFMLPIGKQTQVFLIPLLEDFNIQWGIFVHIPITVSKLLKIFGNFRSTQGH